MRISDLSKVTGVSQRMLRYYEELGLLSPARSEGDYRVYSVEHQSRVMEIRELQRLGLALKEVSDLLAKPETAESIFQAAFLREKIALNEKQKSLQDLKARILNRNENPLSDRTAYSVPKLDELLGLIDIECKSTEYTRLKDWEVGQSSKTLLIGEIIWQSSLYLLASPKVNDELQLEALMRKLCIAANKVWRDFDGNPPTPLSADDIHEFIAPSEIVIVLTFKDQSQIVLPYSSVFALAKTSEVIA